MEFMMAIFTPVLRLMILLLAPQALGLQVTPNSPCAPQCIDDPSGNLSDPNSSNTYPSDIVCADADYTNTAAGRKYEACINCLRNSTLADDGENDQSWFLYNVRYAVDSCLFPSTNVTDAVSTPCSTTTSCGPLQKALSYGNFDPSTESTYGYCSADSNALLGASLAPCISCLQDGTTETYLANFLIVLQAGCLEQPVSGVNIGIRGNIFSSNPINITFPGDNPGGSSPHRKGISEGAIIGIVIGSLALILILTAWAYISYRKYQNSDRRRRLRPRGGSRFGSKSISLPNTGSYGDSYVSPLDSQQFDITSLSQKERQALGLPFQYPNNSTSIPPSGQYGRWQDASAHLEAIQNQSPSSTTIPIHQAYIPPSHTGVSPVMSSNSTTTFAMSPMQSSTSSPNMASPATVASSRSYIPIHAPQPISMGLRPGVKAFLPPEATAPRSQTASQPVQRVTDLQQPRPAPPPPSQRQEGISLIPQPAFHSTASHIRTPYPPIAQNDQPPAKSKTNVLSWVQTRRSSQSSSQRSDSQDRLHKRKGSGNSSDGIPIGISGPMINHKGRFGSAFAAEDERARERARELDPPTPSSAVSEEQWPGSY